MNPSTDPTRTDTASADPLATGNIPARVKRVVASVKRLKAGYRCSSDVL